MKFLIQLLQLPLLLFAVAQKHGIQPADESDKNHAVASASRLRRSVATPRRVAKEGGYGGISLKLLIASCTFALVNGMSRMPGHLALCAKLASCDKVLKRSWSNLAGKEVEAIIVKMEKKLLTSQDASEKQKLIDTINNIKTGKFIILQNKQGFLSVQKRITVQDGTHEPAWGEKFISFDSERMIPGYSRHEGFWAPPKWDYPDYDGPLSLPNWHVVPWLGKAAFLSKLNQVEKYGEDVFCTQHRGYARCRILKGGRVGSKEFHDLRANIIWPEGYGDHYIKIFNCRPSREFYRYIMNFNQFKKSSI